MKKDLRVFVGVGLTRSGTTWAFQQIKKHPEILASKRKETNYFHKHSGVKGFYDKFHFPSKEHTTLGEFDPTYFKNQRAADNVLATFPNAKTFIIIRNPAERIFTAWKVARFKGKISKTMPFMQFFDLKKSKKKFNYGDNLREWTRKFPELKSFFYEDLKDDPLSFIQSIFTYLGVQWDFIPDGYEERAQKDYNDYYAEHPVEMKPWERKKVMTFYKPVFNTIKEITGRKLN